ncbi:MAG: beta-propeller fold lactonase family protein [Planctomycetes bacterium]|nr:beta-propeller fold lactonase family protein [Planctomycetota bacterium]
MKALRCLLALAGVAALPVLALAHLLRGDSGPVPLENARQEPVYRSPNHICLSPDGRLAAVVNQSANSVSILEVRSRKVLEEISVGRHPSHAAFSPDGRRLYVSCLHEGSVDVVDLEQNRVLRSFQAGDEPYGVTVSADGRKLYVANSLSDTVSILDALSGCAQAEIPTGRSPRFAVATPDGSRLIVANGLSRSLSIIDLGAGRVVETRDLGRASILRQVACSPDGQWAFAAGILSHDETLPVQVERGWIHSNGIAVVDLARPGHRVTLLVDRLVAGASNPWGLVLSSDQRRLYVSLAGVHEIAIVDLPAALRLVQETAPEQVKALEENVEILERRKIARRVGSGGLGPRGLALSEPTGELLVANYFSDSIAVLDAASGEIRSVIPLGPPQEMTPWRQGELLFNDARITYQGWFSCASCHQEDATIDGLNWDLPNDGLGNSKNVKSLLDAHDTPPSMWSGVRTDMNAAVAAGQRFQGFIPDPENNRSLMAYLGQPKRAPNPHRGRNPESARRGEKIFFRAGCDTCHPPPVYTDLRAHDLGLGTPDDYRSRFDTPSLRECYRTPPYLHDGRAKTLREIFIDHNPKNFHGRTRGLAAPEIEDLINFLKTL